MRLATWELQGEIIDDGEGGFYAVCTHSDCDFSGTTWTVRNNAVSELEDHERDVAGPPKAKIRHSGPVRSAIADLHVTKAEAERIFERVYRRHQAFSGPHAAVNYQDGISVCTSRLRGCKHGDKGFTIKVRGCPNYRAMMLAGIRSEASDMDVLPADSPSHLWLDRTAR